MIALSSLVLSEFVNFIFRSVSGGSCAAHWFVCVLLNLVHAVAVPFTSSGKAEGNVQTVQENVQAVRLSEKVRRCALGFANIPRLDVLENGFSGLSALDGINFHGNPLCIPNLYRLGVVCLR